jgi:hypothetical protein
VPSTYPSTAAQLTVDVLLRQPQILLRRLTDLVNARFVADKVFMRGTPEMVQGGVVRFQRSESIYVDTPRDIEEVATRSTWPRAGWTEAILTDIVHQYGLEVPIADLTVRRSAYDVVDRAMVKLANNLVRFVDTKAMTLLTTDANVQTLSATASWSGGSQNIIKDIAAARKLIADQDQGYVLDTMIVNGREEQSYLNDATVRGALPRETNAGQLQTGQVAPLLGLRQILVTPRLTAGTVVFMESKMAGTIVDERPDPSEGYASYDPGAGFAPVYMKVYREESNSDRIVRAARWPAMWLAEPKSVVVMTGA